MQSILSLNSGSSTIKFSVFTLQNNTLHKAFTGLVDKITTQPHLKIKNLDAATTFEKNLAEHVKNNQDPYEFAINELLEFLAQNNVEIIAAGHRIAHGGKKYRQATLVDSEVIVYLDSLTPLAPLHQPYNVGGIKILQHKFPNIPQVASFDTSFHTTCNQLSQLFAIPKKLIEEGIQRYGFHGLSYEYIVAQLDKYLPPEKANGKIIIAHLGQGTSMCAINNKTSVATTLSFSALDGLPMGTRCGNIDPGVLLHLMDYYKMSYKEIETLLYKESGLLGVSGGISSDMRVLLESENADAKLAVDVFVYKTAAWIGMLTAELQGLDGIIFTAGIGENSPYIREKICERSAWLGVEIDKDKNNQNNSEISTKSSKVFVYKIPTDEELTIAKNTLNFL